MNEDFQLLRQYAAEGNPAVFHELIRRHAHLVYSTALRRVKGHVDLAASISQQTFVDLSRKASRLPPGTLVAAWLHRHTGPLANAALEAATPPMSKPVGMEPRGDLHRAGGTLMEKLGSELDSALDELPEADRDALVIRYLMHHAPRSGGEPEDANHDMGQARVQRALEKLRGVFGRHGQEVTVALLRILLTEAGAGTAPTAWVKTTLASIPTSTATTRDSLSTNAGVGAQTGGARVEVRFGLVAAALLILAIAMTALIQERRIQRLSATNQALSEEASRVRQERDRLSAANEQLRSGPDFVRANRAEVMRLRGDLARARAEAAQAVRLAEAAAKGLPTPAAASIANVSSADPFQASLHTSVPAGGSILTGGWISGPGRRSILIVTPSSVPDDPSAEHILVDARMFDASEEILTRLGYSGFFLSGSELRNATLSSEETAELLRSLDTDGDLTASAHPRVMTTSGGSAAVTLSRGQEKGVRFEFTPRFAANGSVDLSLEVKTAPASPTDGATAPTLEPAKADKTP